MTHCSLVCCRSPHSCRLYATTAPCSYVRGAVMRTHTELGGHPRLNEPRSGPRIRRGDHSCALEGVDGVVVVTELGEDRSVVLAAEARPADVPGCTGEVDDRAPHDQAAV